MKFFGLSLLLVAITLGGCSKFRKLQKNPDWKVKYEAAVAYYEKEDYHRSIILLEDILPIMRGSKEAELANFYLSYCYYYQEQYLLSAHHFSQFVRVYGRSKYVIEAEYRNAFSLYKQSPDYALDQTSTVAAIAAMQKFIDDYPSSEFVPEATTAINALQEKLEKKAFETCKLYFKLGRLKASLVVFENFKNDFPDSKYREDVDFMNIKVAYELAEKSITSKQEERYKNTIQLYTNFLDKYPSSQFIKESEKIYSNSLEELSKFASRK